MQEIPQSLAFSAVKSVLYRTVADIQKNYGTSSRDKTPFMAS